MKGKYPILKERSLRDLTETLKKVVNFLDKHKITYWLHSGTLLGAVRHGGFIPWDDDIDVCIKYEDVKRLKEIIKGQNDFVLKGTNTKNQKKGGGGYKIYTKDTSKNLVRYPFVDLIVVKERNGVMDLAYPLVNGNPSFIKAKELPRECHHIKDVFPLRKVDFEGIQVNIPHNPEKILKKQYGEDCLKEGYYKKPAIIMNHKFNEVLYNLGIISG